MSLLNLKASEAADSIYYADLFTINNRNWLITGAGKSDAGRLASKKDPSADLGRDSFAIKNENNSLFARFDPGALNQNSESTLHIWHKIDVVAYCFSEEETNKAYSKRSIALLEADNQLLSTLLVRYPYPAYAAANFFSEHVMLHLENPTRRFKKFVEITNDVINTKFVVVPFMPTVEQKAQLYLNYTPGNEETFI